MINEADKLDLIDPEQLRSQLDARAGQPGIAIVRDLLDKATFNVTDSELERRFIPIARAAGLPPPLTQQRVNGFKVDFYWPDLGLVIRSTPRRASRSCASRTPRSGTSHGTCRERSPGP